jgi:hypothetical protein
VIQYNTCRYGRPRIYIHVVGNPWVDTEKGKWDGVSYKTLTINFSFNNLLLTVG